MKLENAQKVALYLKSKGLDPKQTAALLGNIAVESGYTFDYSKKQEGKRKDPAIGLFQLDPRGSGLYKPYMEYLKDTSKEDSMEAQLDFMVDSLSGDYKKGTEWMGYGNVKNFKDVLKKGTASEATQFFSEKFLRPGKPHLDRRIKATEDLLPLVYQSYQQGM